MSCGTNSAALLAVDNNEANPIVAAWDMPSLVGEGPSMIFRIRLAIF